MFAAGGKKRDYIYKKSISIICLIDWIYFSQACSLVFIRVGLCRSEESIELEEATRC